MDISGRNDEDDRGCKNLRLMQESRRKTEYDEAAVLFYGHSFFVLVEK